VLEPGLRAELPGDGHETGMMVITESDRILESRCRQLAAERRIRTARGWRVRGGREAQNSSSGVVGVVVGSSFFARSSRRCAMGLRNPVMRESALQAGHSPSPVGADR
jgi:hypothetical protein